MKFLYYIITFSLLTSTVACKKDDPVPPVILDPCQDTGPQDLQLQFRMLFNNEVFEINKSYQLNDTTYVSFREAKIYFSNISLQKEGNLQKAPEDVILIDVETFDFPLGKFSPGTYTGLQVSLGVDSLRNHADPLQYESRHPLGLQNPSMHWGWNQGYIFALLEGNYSNNPISSANPGDLWYYHIGMDGNFQVSDLMPLNYEVKACEPNTFKLSINMAGVFDDIDVFTENAGVTSDNFGLSYRIGTNLINSVNNEN
ncbi:MAG: MbnP family protein [Bacteroidia bacterium]